MSKLTQFKKGQRPHNYKHGLKDNPIYKIWKGMKRRCYNPNEQSYKHYGGRGITVCEEWLHDPVSFVNWAKDKWQKGLQLDRRENNGDYSPDNCRFVTGTINQRNTRQNRMIEYKGEIRCLSEWCEILGLNYPKIQLRVQRLKWPIERAFTE